MERLCLPTEAGLRPPRDCRMRRPGGGRGVRADQPSRLLESEDVAERHPPRRQRKHLQAYLDEFTFRFNRRFYPFNAFRSLLGIAGGVAAPTYAELYSGDWTHPTCSGCLR